jgi:hypothetical protein
MLFYMLYFFGTSLAQDTSVFERLSVRRPLIQWRQHHKTSFRKIWNEHLVTEVSLTCHHVRCCVISFWTYPVRISTGLIDIWHFRGFLPVSLGEFRDSSFKYAMTASFRLHIAHDHHNCSLAGAILYSSYTVVEKWGFPTWEPIDQYKRFSVT